jgi:hypothetical protein
MVKANDLINQQKKREDEKFKSYNKIYSSIEKKIVLASSSNYYYIWYEVPNVILGRSFYDLDDCIQYLKDKLRHDGFKVEYYEPNVFLISWFPS